MKPSDRFSRSQVKWARTDVSPELPGERPMRDCDTETRRQPTALPTKEEIRQTMRAPMPAGPARSRGAQGPEMAPPMVAEVEPDRNLRLDNTLLAIVGFGALLGLYLVLRKQ